MENLSLPEELMVEIMLRLPVRSLMRFKLVCKSWLYVIFDPQFGQFHFDLAATPTHRLLQTFSTGYHIKSLDFESSLSHGSNVVYFKYPTPPLPHTCPHLVHIVGHCRGIMLLATMDLDVIVWNPSTGIYRHIPVTYDTIRPFKYSNLIGFGYDKSTEDYLLVIIPLSYWSWYNADEFSDDTVKNSHTQIEVFSLKTNVSSFIQGLDFEYDQYPFYNPGLFLNQSLHWLVISKATRRPLVLAFDLIDRSLSEILLSPVCVGRYIDGCYFTVLGGCLSLCCLGENGAAHEIWVMKEYKVSSSWTRSFVLSPNMKNPFIPICFTKDGELLASSGDETIMKLDENGQVLEHHTDGLIKINFFEKHPYVMYRESLLPLP